MVPSLPTIAVAPVSSQSMLPLAKGVRLRMSKGVSPSIKLGVPSARAKPVLQLPKRFSAMRISLALLLAL